MKTSELTDLKLDWAVSRCLGVNLQTFSLYYELTEISDLDKHGFPEFHYSSVYSQGAPILDRELITTRFDQRRQGLWEAYHWTSSNHALTDADEQQFLMYGPTRLVAGLRCFVASRLGAEVEIPDELTKV